VLLNKNFAFYTIIVYMVSIDELLAPLAGDNPAGDDLEYDPLYQELESLAVSVPEKVIGDSVIEGRAADWKQVEKNCTELWKRTRDLRVASFLVAAESVQGGVAALASAFRLLNFLVTTLWDDFYPRLDPDDNNDPLERLNILLMLSPEAEAINDPVMFITQLRLCRLVPALPYTVRDLMIASGDLETGDGTAVESTLISAELLSLPLEAVETQAQAAKTALELIGEFCAAMNEKMGGAYTISMQTLSREVDYVGRYLAGILARMGTASAPAAEGTAESKTSAPAAVSSAAGGPQNLGSIKVRNREDALLLLRKGADYFEKEEKSSPIPQLVKRAIRFSEMDFMDLLADIAPDALGKGREILGIREA
jgi:type VI secretion system protein ImpA